jgi:hypothetical protein
MFLHHSTSFKVSSALYPFTTQTFTNAGVTGRFGPTITQCRTAYTSSSWTANSLYFNMTTQGYQLWTVPATGVYNFFIAGSRAGIYPGQSTTGSLGFGASIQARLSLTINQVITIICGSYTDATTASNFSSYQGLGGGGGTFVSSGATLLLAAGGGGGNSLYGGTFLGTSGALATTGRPSVCSASHSVSLGGTAGSGGTVGSSSNQYNGGAGQGGAGTIGNAGGGGGSYIISSATNVGTPNGTFEGISTFNGVTIQNLGGTNFPLYGFNNSSGVVTVTKI